MLSRGESGPSSSAVRRRPREIHGTGPPDVCASMRFAGHQLVGIDFFLFVDPLEHLLPQRVRVRRTDRDENLRGNLVVSFFVAVTGAPLREDRQLLLKCALKSSKPAAITSGPVRNSRCFASTFARSISELRNRKRVIASRRRRRSGCGRTRPASMDTVRSAAQRRERPSGRFRARLILFRGILAPGSTVHPMSSKNAFIRPRLMGFVGSSMSGVHSAR